MLTCSTMGAKVHSFENVIPMLSFTIETVKVNTMVDRPASINLGKFWIGPYVLDGGNHPGLLQRRKNSNMITKKRLLERCGLGSLVSFCAKKCILRRHTGSFNEQ